MTWFVEKKEQSLAVIEKNKYLNVISKHRVSLRGSASYVGNSHEIGIL